MRKIILLLVVLIVVGIQFISVERTNPPVTYHVKWDSQETLSFAKRACFDCHSNETVWPWYSKIAPVSWFIADDVNGGRKHLNFSTGKLGNAPESAEELEGGKMPLKSYLILHPKAKLSDQEKQAFIQGLKNTFGTEKHREEQ